MPTKREAYIRAMYQDKFNGSLLYLSNRNSMFFGHYSYCWPIIWHFTKTKKWTDWTTTLLADTPALPRV